MYFKMKFNNFLKVIYLPNKSYTSTKGTAALGVCGRRPAAGSIPGRGVSQPVISVHCTDSMHAVNNSNKTYLIPMGEVVVVFYFR